MPRLNQKGSPRYRFGEAGVVHLLIPLLLIGGIIVTVWLVTNGNPLKLFSRATNPPIVFKSSTGVSLPTNSSGVPQSVSATVKVELTSPLGSPVTTSSGSVSGPVATGTSFYRIAEDPTALNSASYISYTQHPTVLTYTFTNSSLGQKFLWVDFKGSDGTVDRRSAQIEIVSSNATVTVSPNIVERNGTLNVTWAGIANPNLGDYINITTADDQHGVTSHTYWINNNCTWFTPTSGTPKSSGSCTISLNNDNINEEFAGPYHLVLASGTTPGVTTVLAKSNNFNLSPVSVTVQSSYLAVKWNFPDKPYLKDALFLKNADGTNATNSGPYYLNSNCTDTTPSGVTPKNVGQCTIKIDAGFAGGKTGSYMFALYTGSTEFPSVIIARSNVFNIGIASPSPTSTPAPVACTACSADIDKSGAVDIVDYSRLVACFNKTSTQTDSSGRSCAAADINGNGVVNMEDFSCLRSKFGQRCTVSTPTPISKPDLIVTGITPLTSSVKIGTWNYYRVTVKNQSTSGSNNTSSNVYMSFTGPKGRVTSCQGSYPNVGPGKSTTAELYCIAYDPGYNTVKAIVDYSNRVSESNESNNTYTTKIYIRP